MVAKPMDAEARYTDSQHGLEAAISPAVGSGDAIEITGAAGRRHRGAAQRRVSLLAHTLEHDVIPRLVLARREAPVAAYIDSVGALAPTAEDVSVLTALAQQGDLGGALAYVAGLTNRGMKLERIYLGLLAPVARRLGTMWEQDECDFTAVTVGLCCLQQVVLEHGSGFRPRFGKQDIARRVLLAQAPGEQHSFGLLMVGEFFRRQGWDVTSGTGATPREVVALARKEWFGIVGFSMADETHLEGLAAVIRDVRRASRNPQIGVMVGGRAFNEQPQLAVLVGADATATDGQQAALKAETLLALLAREQAG